MLWIEAQIGVQHAAQCEQEQARKNNQYERECNLCDYETCTNLMLLLRCTDGCARFQGMIRSCPGCAPRRNDAGANAGKYSGAQRHSYHVDIQVDAAAPHERVSEEYFHRSKQCPSQ